MSEVLKLARRLAAKDLSWTEAVVHDSQREMRILAARATLHAIDAAIAAESMEAPDPREFPELRIDLGDATIETSVSVEGGKRVMARQRREKSEPLRIPIVADTSGIEEALRNAAKDRVNIEINLDRPSITVDGDALDVARVVKFLLSEEACLATGGFVTDKVPFGVVGERVGETIISSGLKSSDDVVGASGRPIQTGDIVQLKGEFKVVGMREDLSPFRILNGPCIEELGSADVVYTVRRRAPTGHIVGDEIEVSAEELRRP